MILARLPRLTWLRGVAALVTMLAVTLPATPARADRVRDMQWFWDELKVSQAQQVSTGKGVTVALIDTGVDRTHPDLKGVVQPGWQLTQQKPMDNSDPQHHGTGMAGLIAGQGHGSGGNSGVRGVAPGAEIMPIGPTNDTLFVANGIDWAVEHGAKVINMSFECQPSDVLQDAIRNARAAGVVLVSSAGNEAKEGNTREYPGAYPEVITVGSLDRNGKIDATSNHGEQVDLSAPGVDIIGPRAEGGYSTMVGTSNSAAIVSATAALIYAKYPGITPDQVEARLLGTAIDRGDKGRDDYYGAGALNLLEALTGPQPAVGPDSAAASTSATSAAVPPAQADSPSRGLPAWLFPIVSVAVLILVVGLIIGAILLVRRRKTA